MAAWCLRSYQRNGRTRGTGQGQAPEKWFAAVAPLLPAKATLQHASRQAREKLNGSAQQIDGIEQKLPLTSYAGSIRANAAFFALFEDDAAIDFFHLDAQVLYALSGASRKGIKTIGEIKGIVRVVLSPTMLVYLLDRCSSVAEEVQKALQSGKAQAQLSQG